ncbi:uroporphyrinogen-III synthase [Paenibacillus sp. SORGH_AS306]|nr:uroporphyrinogen-III synthase [Paenibacillus sp. SORGH_AS_0306]
MNKVAKPLSGKTIVIAGSRKLDEMSSLIQKQGGTAIVRSLQGVTTFKEQEMEQELRLFIENQPEWVIFTTGIGAKALFDAADRLGIKDAFVQTVQQAKIAIRGYKTYNFLKTQELAPNIRDSDGTMKGLEEQLESVTFTKEQIWIQLHGEPAPDLVQVFGSERCFICTYVVALSQY